VGSEEREYLKQHMYIYRAHTWTYWQRSSGRGRDCSRTIASRTAALSERTYVEYLLRVHGVRIRDVAWQESAEQASRYVSWVASTYPAVKKKKKRKKGEKKKEKKGGGK